MRLLLFILIFQMLLSCKSTQTASVEVPTTENFNPTPSWINQDPISSEYYIGIGFGKKGNPDINFREQAKKNALNDLASQIDVKIKSNSILYTMESNERFNEDFKSTIQTQITKDLKGFELVDSWEDSSTYAVYFRLSKAIYAEQQRLEKEAAMNQSYDWYQKALEAEDEKNFVSAINLNARALVAIEKYWNEANQFTHESGSIFLDNEIYNNLERLMSGLEIQSVDQIELSHRNAYSSSVKITCFFNGQKAINVPLIASYLRKEQFSGNQKMYQESVVSNQNGEAVIQVSQPFLKPSNALEIQVDPSKLLTLNETDAKLIKGIMKNFLKSSKQVPFQIVFPSIYIQSNESLLGNSSNQKVLENTFKSALVAKNYQVISAKQMDEMTLVIETDTEARSSEMKFVPAHLNGEIKLIDNTSGRIVYTYPLVNIKGVHSDGEKASMKAYEEVVELIQYTIIEELINSISK